MKLVDLTCTGCGANVKVQPDRRTAICSVCGKEMLIEPTGEFAVGYEREMGRIQAQRDTEAIWKQEREELLRMKEEEEKRKLEQAEKDRINKGLKYICLLETIVCFVFFVSAFVGGGLSQRWIRVPASFIQLALVAVIAFCFTKDKFFKQIFLACVICAVASIVTTAFSWPFFMFVIFNIIKLVFMMRVERVSYSWKEIFSFRKGKEKNE